MTKKTVRAASGAVIAAMVGVMMAACTTVVHDRTPDTIIVKEKSAPDVVIVPQN